MKETESVFIRLKTLVKKRPFTFLQVVIYVIGLVFSLVWSDLKVEYGITILFLLLTIITIVELKTGLILNKLTYPGITLGIALAAKIGLESFISSLIGMVICGGVFFVIYKISPKDMGGGIGKLGAMIGVFVGWKLALIIFFITVTTAGVYAIILLMRGRKRTDQVEYGPFLSIAAIVVVILNLVGVNLWVVLINQININEPPKITSAPVTLAAEGTVYTYDVEATDANVTDNLTFSLDVFPAGMEIDQITGLIHWVPTKEMIGEKNVIVRISDSENATDIQSFTITVKPDN